MTDALVARRPIRVAAGALTAALALVLVHQLTGVGDDDLLDRWIPDAIVLGAAGLCFARAVLVRSERLAWSMIGLGAMSWALGGVWFSVFLGDGAIPIPSVADGFWLACYPLFYVGLVLLVRRRVPYAGVARWLDGAIGAVAVGALGAALLLEPLQEAAAQPSLAATVTNLAYPIGDLVLLTLLAAGLTLSRKRRDAALWLLAAGIALFALADAIYLVQIADGSYELGGLLDSGWYAGLLLIGVAAAMPAHGARHAAAAGAQDRSRLVPVLAGLVGLLVLALEPRADELVPFFLAIATLALALVRMSVSLRENAVLLALRERESVTDALTELGNRRQLVADLDAAAAAASDDDPRLLVLFDLDGFKTYNDTFGHGAGDALLIRIASSLADAVGARGRAYRMGGDEFCALLRPGAASPERVGAELAATIGQHGHGFDVAASHGCALLPRDARDTTMLMRRADDEMYARKASRRPGADRQVQDALLAALRERDPWLGDHATGVAGLAAAVGRELGLSASDQRTLVHVAALHDIGKIAIPDAIVDKPAPLNRAEWEFMRTHPLIAQRIISAAPALGYAAKLVRSIQERWDGNGYPDGLSGERIPLLARVVAACSAYDAMRTERPYRAARTESEALAELRRCAGTQFDPDVIEALAATLAAAAAAQAA